MASIARISDDAARGAANGVAPLDASSDVPIANLPTGTSSTTVAIGNDTRITGAVPNTRTITAGTGLTGGGDLSANRTLTVAYGSTSTTAATGDHTHTVQICRKHKTAAASSLPIGTTAVALPTTTYNRGSLLDASVSNGIKATVAGMYLITACLTFIGGASGFRDVIVYVNSPTIIQEIGFTGVITRPVTAFPALLAANDVVSLGAYVDSASVQLQANSTTDVSLSVMYLGP